MTKQERHNKHALRLAIVGLLMAVYQVGQTQGSSTNFTLTGHYDIALTIQGDALDSPPQRVATGYVPINTIINQYSREGLPGMTEEMNKLIRKLRGKIRQAGEKAFIREIQQGVDDYENAEEHLAVNTGTNYQTTDYAQSSNEYFRNRTNELRKTKQ